MNKLRKRGTIKLDPDLAGLETYLEATLISVPPRAAFVMDLKKRLLEPASEERSSRNKLQYLILAVAGVVTSILLVITGVRATSALLGSLKNSMAHKGHAPLNPAA